MSPDELAKTILANVIHITIASVDENGQPWNTPVYSAFDDAYNLYWTSAKTNQHSQNIRTNSKVFIVVYDSTDNLGDKTGFYIQARAEELIAPNKIEAARALLQGRIGKAGDSYEKFVGQEIRRVYKAVPLHTWINDAEFKDGDFLRDYRVEVKLL